MLREDSGKRSSNCVIKWSMNGKNKLILQYSQGVVAGALARCCCLATCCGISNEQSTDWATILARSKIFSKSSFVLLLMITVLVLRAPEKALTKSQLLSCNESVKFLVKPRRYWLDTKETMKELSSYSRRWPAASMRASPVLSFSISHRVS